MTSDLKSLQRRDAAHHLHPFTDAGDLARVGTRVIERAEGVYLWDANGHKMLDGMSGLWCVNVGYGREELAEAAHKQMRELPYYNSFFQCTTPTTIALSERLAGLSPSHINHTFFCGSGSEANDTVLRLVRYYWALQGEPRKSVVISRHNAYHGSTMAGASLGGMKFMHEQGELPIPGIVHIDQPYWYGEGGDEEPDEFGLRVARQLEETILRVGASRVAAFIAEPIQGAGGVIIPPDSYWPEIQRICDHYGILLIADEVICGFGRLGEWFGSQHFDIRPDFMPIAKGMTSGYLPMGGVMVSDRVVEVLKARGGEIAHGYTYSGHPTVAAVALKNLDIIESEGLVDRVRDDIGPYLQSKWRTLADHPLVGEVRGVGLIGALELVANKSTRARYPGNGKVGMLCRDACIRNGLVMRATRDTMLISPPLVIKREEADELVSKARRALDETLSAIESGALEAA